MRNRIEKISFSPVKAAGIFAGALVVTYIGMIAFIMSYAAHTIEYAQSVRNEEAAVAGLEQQYLAAVAEITQTDYQALGYVKPTSKTFVRGTPATALR